MEQEEEKKKEKTIFISLPQFKGKNKYETIENYSILFIVVGAIVLSLGIGLTALGSKGIPTIIAMLGSLVTFISTVVLIFLWLAKELFGSE